MPDDPSYVELKYKLPLALEFLRTHRYADAAEIFGQACKAQADDYRHWFNLGLALKGQRNWVGALQAFVQARNRAPANVSLDSYTALLWNVGICSTLINDWNSACVSWDLLGFRVEVGSDRSPVVALGNAWGETPDAMLVPGTRIDPARICVDRAIEWRNQPIPRNSILIHDGSRIGVKLLEGTMCPIFPVLDVRIAATIS